MALSGKGFVCALLALSVAGCATRPVPRPPEDPVASRVFEGQQERRALRQDVMPSIWRPRVLPGDGTTTTTVSAYLLDDNERAVLVSPGAAEIEGDIDDLVLGGDDLFRPAIRGLLLPPVREDAELRDGEAGVLSTQSLRFLTEALQRRQHAAATREDLRAARRGQPVPLRRTVLVARRDAWSPAGDAAFEGTGLAPTLARPRRNGTLASPLGTFIAADSLAPPITAGADPMPLSTLLPSDRFEEMLLKAGALTTRNINDPVFIDDSDGAFESVGEWIVVSDWPHAYGTTARLSGGTGAVAGWRVLRLRPGIWGVWAKWRPGPDMSRRAELRIYSSGSDRPSVTWTIDQSTGTHGWNRLGDWVAATSNPLLLELRSGDGLPIMADAFVFAPIRLAKHDPIRVPGEARPRLVFEEVPDNRTGE